MLKIQCLSRGIRARKQLAREAAVVAKAQSDADAARAADATATATAAVLKIQCLSRGIRARKQLELAREAAAAAIMAKSMRVTTGAIVAVVRCLSKQRVAFFQNTSYSPRCKAAVLLHAVTAANSAHCCWKATTTPCVAPGGRTATARHSVEACRHASARGLRADGR